MTLEKYVQELTLQQMRPNTIKNAQIVLGCIDRYKPLDEVTAADLKNYFEKYSNDF